MSCNCAGKTVPAAKGSNIAVNATGTLLFEATVGESQAASGVVPYGINPSSGALTPFGKSFIPVGSTGGPSLAPDSTGEFLYASGPNVDQILGFTVSKGGAVTPVPGSPFTNAGSGGLTIVNVRACY